MRLSYVECRQTTTESSNNRKIMTFEKLLTELRAMFTENIDNVQIYFKANKNEAQVYVNGKYWATYELE